MRPRHSEIFEAYSKLAEKQGLIKTAEEKTDKESPELKKYKSEVYARVGSDSISDIEALYGLKIETIPGMEYEKNISQSAHPNAIVISPAYDPINGLVENINERANIIHNKIMSKEPSGSLFLLKDAQSELTMELIRIANDMDNADEEELRLLTDSCLENLQKNAGWLDDAGSFLSKNVVKPLFGGEGEKALSDIGAVGKGAAEGAAVGALVGAIATSWGGPLSLAGAGVGGLLGGAAGGLAAYLVNTGSKVKSIKDNAESFLRQLEDVETKAPNEARFFEDTKKILTDLIKASDTYIAALNVVRSKEDNKETASESEINEVKKDAAEFVALIDLFENKRKTFNQKALEGAFSASLNKTPGLDNDIQDVEKEFISLSAAIDNLKSTMDRWVGKTVAEVKKTEKKEPVEVKKEEQKPMEEKKDSWEGVLSPVGIGSADREKYKAFMADLLKF